jgi:CheY-like chemotaxis protein
VRTNETEVEVGIPVMVVDDEPQVRDIVLTVLEQDGIDVTEARSGEECLERLGRGFRGLILLDVVMPGLDGWATIREMKKRDLLEGNVICMLTGMEEPGLDTAGLEDCVVDYLVKASSLHNLSEAVRGYAELLDRS